MRAWIESKRERSRKADCERVAKVRGRKMRMDAAVESLEMVSGNVQRSERK